MRFRFSNQHDKSPSFFGLLFGLLVSGIGVDNLIDALRQRDSLTLWALSLFCLVVGITEIYRNAKGLIKQRKRKQEFELGYDLGYNTETGEHDDRDRSQYCPYCGRKVRGDFEFCKHCGKRLT